MSAPAISVKGLRKSYGNVTAVDGIDLEIETGRVFALLGPTGAGKPTTVEILEGYRDRDAGEVAVLGHDPAHPGRELRTRVGIVLQATGVDPYLTVRETIELYRQGYPHPRPVDEVIEVVGLAEKSDERVVKLSGGQQRRLDVAVALAGDPDLLFLDEPTTGFDPGARRTAWGVVKNLEALGKTIFLTTHYMDEAQNLAEEVAIISRGKIVAQGSPESLTRRSATSSIRWRTDRPDEVPASVRHQARREGESFLVTTNDPTRVVYELTRWAVDEGGDLQDLSVTRPSLEDVYLEITGATSESGGRE